MASHVSHIFTKLGIDPARPPPPTPTTTTSCRRSATLQRICRQQIDVIREAPKYPRRFAVSGHLVSRSLRGDPSRGRGHCVLHRSRSAGWRRAVRLAAWTLAAEHRSGPELTVIVLRVGRLPGCTGLATSHWCARGPRMPSATGDVAACQDIRERGGPRPRSAGQPADLSERRSAGHATWTRPTRLDSLGNTAAWALSRHRGSGPRTGRPVASTARRSVRQHNLVEDSCGASPSRIRRPRRLRLRARVCRTPRISPQGHANSSRADVTLCGTDRSGRYGALRSAGHRGSHRATSRCVRLAERARVRV